MKYIDLHTHSNFSDGSMTPTELVAHAKEKGIAAIALSDHDTVDGVAEALEAGKRFGVEVVPAIELSVQSATETHILGYYIDTESRVLVETLKKIKESRLSRTVNICRKLNALGFEVSIEEVAAIAPSGIIGRTHFAAVMVQKGYIGSIREGFDKYLANGRPAYDGDNQYLTAEAAVRLIDLCGGVSFVAHPHLIRLSDEELTIFLKKLKSYGLSGIEGYYNEYTPAMQEYFQNKARELGLAVSGGSDFHAKMKPHIEIGVGQGDMLVPYSVLETIKKLVKEKREKEPKHGQIQL